MSWGNTALQPWNEQIKQALLPLRNADNAAQMQAYLRGQFEFYGIQAGPRRAAMKDLFTAHHRPTIDELPAIVNELWEQPEREFQMVAVDLLISLKSQLPPTILPDLEHWITTKSWWDSVDMLATHIVGSLYLHHRATTAQFIQTWRNTDNLWLRRTTLLFQLKYKLNTDTDLLFELIRENNQDRDFFIQKAIGWVLREYSKTDPHLVMDFLDSGQITGLARREALKWLKSQGNVGSPT